MPTATAHIKFNIKHNIPFIPTKMNIFDGRKVPSYIRGKGSPNEFNINPFYKWTPEEVENHKKWLNDTGKIKQCDAIINLIYQTNFIMIDTDNEETDKKIEELGFKDTFYTKSTREKGKHYYIKTNKDGKWKKEIKINNEDIDFITDYCFEKLEKETGDYKSLIEMEKPQLEEILKFKIKFSGQKIKQNKEALIKYHARDNSRNAFLNKDDYIVKELLFEILNNIDPNYFSNFTRWKQLVIGLHNQVRKIDDDREYMALLLDITSKMDNFKPDYIRENLDFWNKLGRDHSGDTIKSGTFWYWLKENNPDKFIELKNKRNGKVNFGIFNELREYEIQKKYFEEYVCAIRGSKMAYKEYDKNTEEWTDMNQESLKQNFHCLQTWVEIKDKKGNKSMMPVSFIEKWLLDPYRKVYEGMDFKPPPLKIPDTWFNLYDGLAIDDIPMEIPDNLNIIEETISPILTHIYNLSGRNKKNYDFFLKILSYNFKYTGERTKVAIVLRSKQGTGKNAFLEYIGQLQGMKYYSCSSDHEVFLSRFANGFDGCLTAVFDEMEMGHKVEKRLKELTTANHIFQEKKGIMSVKQTLIAQMWYASNKDNPIKIDEWNRRNDVFDCYEGVRFNEEYFDNLFDAFNNDYISKCFVHYLREVINVPINYNFERNRPCGQAYKDVIDKNSPPFINFLQSLRHKPDDLDSVYSLKALNLKFTRFLKNMNYSYCMDFRQFKQQLKAYSEDENDIINNHRIFKKFRLYEKAPINYKIDMEKYESLMDEYEEESDRNVRILTEEESANLNHYKVESDEEDED